VNFLVSQGIDSISVNADVASTIAEYISEIESSIPNIKTIKKEKNDEKKEPIKKTIENFEELPRIPGSEYIEKPTEDEKEDEILLDIF